MMVKCNVNNFIMLCTFKERFNKLDDNISPEIIRSLSKIGLTIKLLNLGDIRKFLNKAIDPSSKTAIKNSIAMLKGKLLI